MGIFRTKGRIRREAAQWAARLGAGAGAGDHDAFRRWYEADAANAEAYDRIAAIWSAAGKLPASPGLQAPGHTQPRRRAYQYAAAVALVAGLALLLLLLFGTRWLPQSDGGAALSFASATGQVREFVLPDGSRLLLDTDTQVDLSFSATERRLTLRRGRARFAVAHEDRTFLVSAGSNEVVATGTLFDLSLSGDRLAVILIEGSVDVRPANARPQDRRFTLVAGEKLVLGGPSTASRSPIPRGETSWPSRMLQFDGTPLSEAAAQVNRYSRVQLLIADERIGSLRVSGAYRAGDVAGFARSLAVAFDLQLERLPDGNLRLSGTPAARH